MYAKSVSFLPENVISFCSPKAPQKAPQNFFKLKSMSTFDFVGIIRLNESLTDDIVKLTML